MGVNSAVVAIGLDAASLPLLDAWIEAGHLPVLAALRERSARIRLWGPDAYRAETPWTCFLTGSEPERTGYWTLLRFRPRDYSVDDIGAYDFHEHAPFYALGDGRRVAVVDVPQSRLRPGVDGVQVVSWGAHSPMAPRGAQPPELLTEIEERFGRHPGLLRDEATLWRPSECRRLEAWLADGIARRAAICEHLLQREQWDLFVTVFGETHSAGHWLWHLSRPDHPISGRVRMGGGDPLLRTYQAIDRAVGRILVVAPEKSRTVVFSTEGMEPNFMDLPSMVFLPELLYRSNFSGCRGLGADGHTDLSAVELPSRAWVPATWSTQATTPLRRFVRRRLPSAISYRLDRLWPTRATDILPPYAAGSLSYQPPLWYRHLWPRMRAFALPSFSEGYVRINVVGREAAGIVEPRDYDAVCEAVAAEINGLTDARSGKPIVREVRRTRRAALDDDPKLPDADLVVRWMAPVTDTVDTRNFGRIGPMPFYRSGGHTEEGFAWIAGPGIDAGPLADGRVTSLAPTLLSLLGAPIPARMRQQPLL